MPAQYDLFTIPETPENKDEVNPPGQLTFPLGGKATDAEPPPQAVGKLAPELTAVAGVDTLSDVREAYTDAASIHPARGQFRSACNTAARVLGRPLAQIPAAPALLKPMLDAALPRNGGISGVRWRKVLSLLRRALRDLGLNVAMARDDAPLTGGWAQLFEQLTEKSDQGGAGLSRCLHYASRQGVPPEAFQLSDFDGFRRELETSSLAGDTEAICRQTARCWNRAILTQPGWPQVCLPVASNSRRFSFDWSAFPSSLVEDRDAFFASSASNDPFDTNYGRPVRPETLKSRCDRLRILASALVLSGAKRLDEVTSLRVLVQIDNLKAAIAYLRDRTGRLTAYHCGYLALAKTINRHWLLDEVEARKVKAMEVKAWKQVDEPKGMKAKNRERLRQFDNDDNVDDLYALPFKVVREVSKKTPVTRNDAVRVMHALQLAILCFTPIRLQNLTGLEFGKSIIDTGSGRRRIVRVYLAPAEVKNGREYDAELPGSLYKLYDLYLTRYRPMLWGGPSIYLFPGRMGDLRSKIALSTGLKDFIERETGLVMHVHLFRHLMAKLYLEQHPQDIETVRQVLNHKTTQTTMNAYMELRAAPALKRYQETLVNRPVKARPSKAAKKRDRGLV